MLKLSRFSRTTLRRTIRTFLQGFLGALIQEGALYTASQGFSVVRGAIGAGLISAVTFIHNSLEDFFPDIDTREPELRMGRLRHEVEEQSREETR